MTAPLRVAVIGLGVISRFYLAALRDSPSMRLAAVCDSDPAKPAACPVPGYTDHVRLKQCPAQIETLDADVIQLDNEHADLTRQLNLAKAEGDSLNAQINGASTNVGPLQTQVTAAEAQAEDVSRRRTAYEELVTAQGIIAFFYNTVVVALAVNIAAGLN